MSALGSRSKTVIGFESEHLRAGASGAKGEGQMLTTTGDIRMRRH
jgi:hypothetical protein